MTEDIEIIDAHHHFWNLNKNYYPFLSDKVDPYFFLGNYETIRKNYLPVDYIEDFVRGTPEAVMTKRIRVSHDHPDYLVIREIQVLDEDDINQYVESNGPTFVPI